MPHIHGLCALHKEDMDDPFFKDVIMDLQKCSVLDLCPADEGKKLIDEDILSGWLDKDAFEEDARIHLTHRCNQRCKIRVGEGNGPENFRCKKIDTVLASKRVDIMSLCPYIIFSGESSII